ncbi:MAG TPA: cobalamin-dependent protein [Bryobacteraceae bacterium]|nr:cobalamin-dependent protein [Bryobacteraceae bacterium]
MPARPEPLIYLADLGHNQLTVSSDVYPLGVANLATYARDQVRGGERLRIRIFREPQELKAAIDGEAPDVLGLSSYSWNHYLALSFARYAKNKNPKAITMMGGPNFPLTVEEQESWLRGMPEIDIAVRGPTYEGERAFRNVMQRYLDADGTLEGIQQEPVPGNLWINPRTGEFVRGAELDRIVDLDEIPSPYTAGLMDPYFATGYLPMMQIARGCPFSCAFCNSSVKSNSKIYRHSLENLKTDLLYIAERVRPEVALTFADDNFGMYDFDEEVADFIAYLQERFHWPRYIRTTTGKNRGERIIEIMRKIHGALPMTAAVQSMDPVVLKNIERSNIKLDTYTQIQKEVRAQGMQSYGEMILCLPGESKASFMKGIRDLMEAGVTRISAHQLMLLHGAPLSNPESRKRFGLKTMFRVVARDIGNYTGEPVIETEEMVVSTPTFSFEEYLQVRVFHLLLTIFYYESNFEEAFELAKQMGIRPFDLVERMAGALDRAPEGFRKVMDDFVRENREELFPSREACLSWARAHLDGLLSGELGGNLLSKYSMIGRFYATHEALDFLRDVIMEAAGGGRGEAVNAVIEYLRCVLLHCPFAETLEAAPVWQSDFDVEAWSADKYSRPLEAYRCSERKHFVTLVEPEKKALIENRIRTFGEHPSGLGKFTRTLFARQLRRSMFSAPSPAGRNGAGKPLEYVP